MPDVVAGKAPANFLRRPPRLWSDPRRGEKRGPHKDRHLTGRCGGFSPQTVVGYVDDDVRRLGARFGTKRRHKSRSRGWHGFCPCSRHTLPISLTYLLPELAQYGGNSDPQLGQALGSLLARKASLFSSEPFVLTLTGSSQI